MKKYKKQIIAAVVSAIVLAGIFFSFGNAGEKGEQATKEYGAESVYLPEKQEETAPAEPEEKAPEEKPSATPAEKKEEQTQNKEPHSGQSAKAPNETDKYQTEPVPEGKPQPAEPQQTEIGKQQYTCTLSVRCDTILGNTDMLDPEKEELVPPGGVIFAEQEVGFYEGESVFNLLLREMRRNKIHLEFVNTPIYNSAYIEGIANLYEFDCGELSGWMYRVNGWFPNYGCSRYKLKQGDKVEWVYTCDLGKDVGGYFESGGGQKDE